MISKVNIIQYFCEERTKKEKEKNNLVRNRLGSPLQNSKLTWTAHVTCRSRCNTKCTFNHILLQRYLSLFFLTCRNALCVRLPSLKVKRTCTCQLRQVQYPEVELTNCTLSLKATTVLYRAIFIEIWLG